MYKLFLTDALGALALCESKGDTSDDGQTSVANYISNIDKMDSAKFVIGIQ